MATGIGGSAGGFLPASGYASNPAGAVAAAQSPAADDHRAVALLQQMIEVVNQLVAIAGAQHGARLVQGSQPSIMETLVSAYGAAGTTHTLPGPQLVPRGNAPAVMGGGATSQVDMRRIAGTPQPGGVIELLLQRASTVAAPALSGGTWIELADGAGARMQVHVHGAWANHPGRIAEAVTSGAIAVHLHDDGTVHLHDLR